MTLIIFDIDKVVPSIAAQLDPSLRQAVAKRVNEALLRSQGERTKATLYDLVNHRAWANQKAMEAKKDHLPVRIDLGFDPAQNGHGTHNGSLHHNNGSTDAMATEWGGD